MRMALLAALAAASLAGPARAQVGTPAPNSYALTNGRIVTAPGRVIELSTVVIRDGKSVAVGAQISPPADLQNINLTGMTVCPALINATTPLGLQRAAGGDGGGRGGPPQAEPTQQ